MKHIFIINPAAGKADPAKIMVPKISAAFAGRQEPYLVYTTKGEQDAITFVREQCQLPEHQGEQLRFYSCGGDGTAREIVNGMYGFPNACLGVFPCGSGNDFVRNFPGRDFMDVAAQLDGEEVVIDAIRFNDIISVNLCNAGLDADVANNMSIFRRWPAVSGPGAYNLSIIYTFFGKLGNRARITLEDGQVIEMITILTVIGNGQYYGGGYRGAPEADLADGLLDICIVPKVSRPFILKIIGKYKQGLHKVDPDLKKLVTYLKAKKISIKYDQPVTLCVDGECFENDHIDAEIMPGAVRLVLPRKEGPEEVLQPNPELVTPV